MRAAARDVAELRRGRAHGPEILPRARSGASLMKSAGDTQSRRRAYLGYVARVLFTGSLILSAGRSRAYGAPVVIVTDSRVAQYKEALSAAKAELPSSPVLELTSPDLATQLQRAEPAVALAIGQRALQVVQARQPQLPIVYCMVLGSAAPAARTVTGVRLEVQPEQQLALLRSVHSEAKRLGVLYDPRTFSGYVAEVSKAVGPSGVTLVSRPVSDGLAVRPVLAQMIDGIDALWLLPDPSLITSDMFNFLLVYTLEHKVALFAFFDSLTRAGALASVSPDYPQIGRLAARLALDIAAKPAEARLPLPAAQWSPGVLSINANTARQLGIELSAPAQAKASQVYR